MCGHPCPHHCPAGTALWLCPAWGAHLACVVMGWRGQWDALPTGEVSGDTADLSSGLMILWGVELLPSSPPHVLTLQNRRDKDKPTRTRTQRLLSPWLANTGHGAAATGGGDVSAGSGHWAPAWHLPGASKGMRSWGRSCGAPASPLLAALRVRGVGLHRLLRVCALLGAVNVVPVPSAPLSAS